ncbi:acyl-CoA dehydrogenase [Sphingobium sp. AntQ-1]|uniref:acyl-CoA dehydrogenase n=1 Tax=Sphingobium sp. AntQ-1 TaxID=2930091 RepID=UPI00234EC1C0|nr:acyl-CoA dehydrogenase [Sphingobium sp. AntQ-1]
MAVLDHDRPPWTPGMLPPLGHWLCFPPTVRQSLIGECGHPQRTSTGLLPAIDLPRRMWAGSRVRFIADIPLGTQMTRVSTLVAAQFKAGRSGRMLFVTVRHEIAPEGGDTAIIEEQDIVYREAAVPGRPAPRPLIDAGEADQLTRTIVPDPVMLFRYSAVTFNSHRIHYDRDYCRDIEAYPGLVVQGPFIATLLLDHLLRHRPELTITAYRFRAQGPIFDGETITLGLTEATDAVILRAIGPAGPAMVAIAEYR